ncbi:hypothetical protein AB0N28_05185 [Streptomyces sp. NPDC051130]|uniref:hypothetical protein n=1 Tax=Streptomyces sp. NPDC051130 TaxID=3157223 RepID=UPI003429BCD9
MRAHVLHARLGPADVPGVGVGLLGQVAVLRPECVPCRADADWYWNGQGSGHLGVLRTAVLTDTALEIVHRTKDGRQESAVLKPLA